MHGAMGWATVPVGVRSACVEKDRPGAIDVLRTQLGDEPFDILFLFVSPEADFERVVAEANDRFRGTTVVACTTAGEICGGYREDTIVAAGLPRASFRSRVLPIANIDEAKGNALVDRVIGLRQELAAERPDFDEEFDFILIDGLSTREDQLMAELSAGIGPVPLFGGSAGDGTRFQRTLVSCDGVTFESGAVLTLVRTACRVRVFKMDHLKPSGVKMVVTEADPEQRIVRQINAEPAAREYARILGKDPDQLDTFTFAAHPVVVRMGGQHHVRAIQRVTEDGDLVFFCAIDEGMVLTLADAEDMVVHLERELSALSANGAPAAILACDCILRRKEAEQRQMTGAISRLLARHRVVGFSTYGEQLNSLHVNQTLTGVAIYPPGT